jgi:hypothetical protein
MNNIGKAFTFPFHEKDWALKIFLGALFLLLSLVGLGIPVIAGYMIRVCQRVMRNEPELLPEWSDVGILFITGIKYIAVYLIYQLPILLLVLPLLFLLGASTVAELSQSASVVFGIYLLAFLFLAIPYSLLFALVRPVIMYRFALNEKIAEALDIAAIFREFKAQWMNVTLVAVLIVLVGVCAVFGLFLFMVGILATIFYSSVVSGALSGMLYRSLPTATARRV